MEILIIQSEREIRVPNYILKKLNVNVNDGDKVAFIEEDGKIVLVKADEQIIRISREEAINKAAEALRQKELTETNVDEHGISDEDREVVRLVKEVRAEMWEKLYASND